MHNICIVLCYQHRGNLFTPSLTNEKENSVPGDLILKKESLN